MAVNKVIYKGEPLIDITDTTAIASDVIKDKVFYGADGIRTLGTMVEKMSLTFESGTFEPEEDVNRPTIYFQDTHTTTPFLVAIYDVTDTMTIPSGSNVSMLYYDVYRLYGKPFIPINNYPIYASCYMIGNGGSMSNQTKHFAISSDSEDTSSNSPRYYVDETSFRPYCNSIYWKWKTGRTYKWIAIWK